jgi:hypothetical protein
VAEPGGIAERNRDSDGRIGIREEIDRVVGGTHQLSRHPDHCVAGETGAGLTAVAEGMKIQRMVRRVMAQTGVRRRERALAGNLGVDML